MTLAPSLPRLLPIIALTLSALIGSPAAAQSLPDAETLYEAHVEAIGGRDAIAKHKNRVVYGEIEFASGEKQVLIVAQEAPDKLRYSSESPGRFTLVRAFDGETAWGIDADGSTRVLDASSDEAKDLAFNAVFEGDAAYKDQYTAMRTTERTLFNERPVYAVDVTTKGGLSQRVFFDTETKLIIGKTQVVSGGGTPTELVFVYEKYTDYEGVKLVSLQRQVLRGQTNTIRTHFVEVNVDSLPSFTPPESLAASIGG